MIVLLASELRSRAQVNLGHSCDGNSFCIRFLYNFVFLSSLLLPFFHVCCNRIQRHYIFFFSMWFRQCSFAIQFEHVLMNCSWRPTNIIWSISILTFFVGRRIYFNNKLFDFLIFDTLNFDDRFVFIFAIYVSLFNIIYLTEIYCRYMLPAPCQHDDIHAKMKFDCSFCAVQRIPVIERQLTRKKKDYQLIEINDIECEKLNSIFWYNTQTTGNL